MNNSQEKFEDYKIEQIKSILTDWNPLGSGCDQFDDLNNYETEAQDILFHIETEMDYIHHKVIQKRIQKIIKEILNEAFNLWLTTEECEEPALKIMNVIIEK